MKSLDLCQLDYVIFDLETTGLYADQGDEIIEIGAVRISALEIEEESFHRMVKPNQSIPAASTAVHGITNKDVEKAPHVQAVLPEFLDYCGSRIPVAQNARFDLSFILRDLHKMGLHYRSTFVADTIGLSKMLFPYETRHNLDVMMARMGISKSGDRHRAVDDCKYTAQVLIEFIKQLEKQGTRRLDDIQSAFIKPESVFKQKAPQTMGLF